jgi:glycosyltransferase involved in cell wall biosynthesis
MTPPSILISVVVPTYNYAHYLPRALDSVLAQWADDMELIIIDDGSTDATEQLVEAYVARCPRLRYVRQANAGAASARNEGIRQASGKYVLPLDADDELTATALFTVRAMVEAEPETDVILGAHVSVHIDGRERVHLPTPVPKLSARSMAFKYLLDKRISVSHSCILIRRELLLQRPYPLNLRTGEDVPVFAYLLVTGKTVVTNEPLARIYKHPDSLRNDRCDEEQSAMTMVREVFASLPPECQSLRPRYEAQRYLSLFRAALLECDRSTARRFYWHALHLSPPQALRWPYFRKAIRLFFKD